MKKWILGAVAVCAVAGLVLLNLNVTRAGRAVQQPETIASITLQPVISGLSSPVGVYHANDESNRLFIVEQTGIIKVLQPGATTTTNFLNVTTSILCCGERGLLGLAFHPQYRTNGRFFIYYTRTGNGSLQISEFHVSASNPNVADTTEIPLLNILHPTNSNHNGGQLAFGGDGYLYIGPGDGGSGNDPPNNAQNINQLLGKILRIDVDHGAPYTSPATNPFFGATAGADEIWMIGMRNPWRFAFDRANRNQLWIGDVGQGAIEEIDNVDITQNPPSGARNGGWRIFEGTNCTGLDPCTPPPANLIPPVAQYGHTGGRCSLTGGYVYRGRRGTFPLGAYVYADYCTGEILTLIGTTQTLVLDSEGSLTSFGEDEAGEIYACHSGQVRRLVETTALIPRNEIADFDGDLKTDYSVYRSGIWYVLNSFTVSTTSAAFGLASDRPVPGDYDGDGKTDLALWRDSAADYYILNSSNGTFRSVHFGLSGDLPVQGDYDNDRRADIAVYRPSAGVWYYQGSANGALGQQVFGAAGDQPVPGDYNGDGRNDFALFRPSAGQWYVMLGGGAGQIARTWGLNGDRPVAADYDADGTTDVAVYRPTTGGWYISRSSDGGLQSATFGISTDTPVPGDYDADNRDDIAVFRSGVWYVLRSSDGALKVLPFGAASDVPVPSAYKPQ